MIDCWTDLSIHDFELATECGSTPTAAYVSELLSCSSVPHTGAKLKYFLKWNYKRSFLYHRQDSSSMKMIMLMKENNSQVAVSSFFRNFSWAHHQEVHTFLDKSSPIYLHLLNFHRSIPCKSDVCPQWLSASPWMFQRSPVSLKQK